MILTSPLVFSPPKGDFEEDYFEVVRKASDTRPLSMKNVDNKITVAANVSVLEPQFKNITNKCQNGFCPGRNYINNLVDIDASARIFSSKFEAADPRIKSLAKNFPCISSNDFGAAFPSVSHEWLWTVPAHRCMPPRFIAFFKAIYTKASSVVHHNGMLITIILFLSGVLQGCPASAMLFDLALDPFLAMFERVLQFGRLGLVRACADDIAFSLSRLSHMKLIQPIYRSAQFLAGLTLKPVKCNIIPCTEDFWNAVPKVRAWLTANVPDWAAFKVVNAAELLGFFVGPGAAQKMWIKPLAKFKRRVLDIKNAGAGLTLNMLDYNARVVPVLSYVAQLFPLPDDFQYWQRVALHTVYKAPINTFAHNHFFQAPSTGVPKPRCAEAACAAALTRTACKTITGWDKWVAPLRLVAAECLPLSMYRDRPFVIAQNSKSASPGFWDAPAFAELLEAAANCTYVNKKLSAIAPPHT